MEIATIVVSGSHCWGGKYRRRVLTDTIDFGEAYYSVGRAATRGTTIGSVIDVHVVVGIERWVKRDAQQSTLGTGVYVKADDGC